MGFEKESRRVLIVDDDPENLKLIGEVLLREKCEVKTSLSGQDALNILNEWKPALIILDYDMPGLSGLDTLKEIKIKYNDIDVMFVSAHTNPRLVSQALENGADDYLRKPFSLVELRSRVHVRFRIRDLREQLKVANERLAELTVTDDLTGLFNMRAIYEKIEYEIKRGNRNEKNVAVVMLDMDHFKTVNDNHDHLFGSFVLKEMGSILKNNLREVDFAARYGGDEFLIVLTEANEEGVKAFCERIRKKVEGYLFKNKSDEIKLTVSIGYALGASKQKIEARELVRVADHALYQSKEEGRNRVTGFSEDQTYEYLNELKKKDEKQVA